MRILYLDLDTLRPDHLGCYGYCRNTSPNLDRIAAEGVVFDRYYTSDAPCLPSRSALMTGTFGIHNGAINHGGSNAEIRSEGPERDFQNTLSLDNLPAWLKMEAGLYPVYIGGFGERHSTFNYYAGFREIYDTGLGGVESAEDVTPTALRWIEQNAERDNWYLHVNYWDPHTPYRAPADFGNPFANDPLPAWLTEDEIARQLSKTVGPHGIMDQDMYDDRIDPRYPRQPGKAMNLHDARRVIDGYDCGVRYMDEHIGRLLDALKRKGVLDDLVIIASSDHGENLGELGMWSEHGTADHITCRIPMIIRWPGKLAAGQRNQGLHYNIDLLPTLAELLERPPRQKWEGRSYAQGLLDGSGSGRSELILSQCCHGCQRAVRWDDWIYIRTYHDFYHLFDREMLFNVKEDPHEQHNLAIERPDLCREGKARYLDWLDEMMATQPDGYFWDPMWEIISEGGPYHARGHLKQYLRRLEDTGRAWAVPELKRRHPGELT